MNFKQCFVYEFYRLGVYLFVLDMESLQIEDVEREMETEKQIAEVESKEAEQQEQEEVLEDYGMLPDADGESTVAEVPAPLPDFFMFL